LLNLLDAFGNFAQVREIAERSFAHREAAMHMAKLQRIAEESTQRIESKLKSAGCHLSISAVTGFERLVSARARLHEATPQTRAEARRRWLESVVQAGRIVGIGRSGKRLVLVSGKRDGNVRGIREDGSSASFSVDRIGRVYEPVYRQQEPFIEEAFAEVRQRGRELVISEPRLHDAQVGESKAVGLLDDQIETILPGSLDAEEKSLCTEVLWSAIPEAEDLERATRQIEVLREEVWEPFQLRARVLDVFGYLNFAAEKVTERGRWLADLHIERPLLVGEALESGLFNSLQFHWLAGVVAALTADEERNYGQLELEDGLVDVLARFEDIGFKVAKEEWKLGIEPAPELNFSAGAAAVSWATGTEWFDLVRQTGAEEGDLFRLLSRTGEALLQIAGLRKSHPDAARVATIAADAILREPVR
jgi:DSHCT (NUC185) domain